MKYTTEDMVKIETLLVDHSAELKIEEKDRRVWYVPEGLDSGEPFENSIYVERKKNDTWVISEVLDGDAS